MKQGIALQYTFPQSSKIHTHMWVTRTWFRCKKERNYLTSLLLFFMPRVWIGEGERTTEELKKLWLSPLPLIDKGQIEWDRNSKCLLFIFVINKVKIEVAKNGGPLYLFFVWTQHTIVLGQINLQSKTSGKATGENELYDGINAVLWEKKNVCTVSTVKRNREYYALKMSLPLSYSSGGVTKGTIWPWENSCFQAPALK